MKRIIKAYFSEHIWPKWNPVLRFKYRVCRVCMLLCFKDWVNVKQSLYSPGQALRFPGVLGSQTSRQTAHESGKFFSPTHWPSLTQEIFLVLISIGGWVNPDSAAGMIMSMKVFNGIIANRNSDLPACRALPQPTAPPRAPLKIE